MKKEQDYVHNSKVSETENRPEMQQIAYLLKCLFSRTVKFVSGRTYSSKTILKSIYDQEIDDLHLVIYALEGQLKCAQDERDVAIKEREAAEIRLDYLENHPQVVVQGDYIMEQHNAHKLGNVAKGATGIIIKQRRVK